MEVLSPHMDGEKEAFADFLSSYPSYRDTMVIDSMRHEEYPHLDEKGQVCLDYTGGGLFSSSQKSPELNGGLGIGLSYTSANLATHAMYTEDGSTESHFRKRILRYLNLDEDDYYIVFTANAFSAFKLLGESYPFHEAQNLLLAYDHQCENVEALRECSLAKSANAQSAALSFPWLRIHTDDLRKKLQGKRKVCTHKAGISKGLFAYPYSSRVTGCKNSSRWIPEAQQNGWHVLLDVTSVDAKMLDSLGLSRFLPDFVICSFYNVFGEDPTGFGSLVIKKSVLRTLGDSSRARAVGMVKIVTKQPSSSSPLDSLGSTRHGNDSPIQHLGGDLGHRRHGSSPMHSFSFQPEWSADIVDIDNNVFYRSNGDDTEYSKVVLQGDRAFVDDVINRKERTGAGPSQMHMDECSKAVLHGDRTIVDAMMNHKESTGGGPSQMHMDQGSMRILISTLDPMVPNGSFKSRENGEEDAKELSAMNLSKTFLQADMVASTSWQRQDSEIEEMEPLLSYNTKLINSNGGAMKWGADDPLSRRRSVKGLFYGDFDARLSPDRSSFKGLLKHETKLRTESHVQKACNIHRAEVAMTLKDWRAFYARKAKFRSSPSSDTSSSVSAPSSPSRFGIADAQERDIWWPKRSGRSKAAGVSMKTKLTCKGLDHADMLGYKRIAVRLRSLVNWLIFSLSKLRHPQPESSKLVRIYSQMSLADRGSTVAFILSDSAGNAFDPKRVQMLADRSSISVRTGVMEGTLSLEPLERDDESQEEFMIGCVELAGYKCRSKGDTIQTLHLPVIYVSLGFLNNFSDVYRLWLFVSKFLDPEFVNQELWHYQALNQETIEI